MIHLFNRAELMLTYDLSRLNRARDTLAAAGIDSLCRSKDLSRRGSRRRDGLFGLNQTVQTEYKLYVRKEDFPRAKSLL